MGGADVALWEAITSFQLDLNRLEAGVRKNVVDILTRMQRELVAALSDGQLSDYTQAKKQALLRQVTEILNRYYTTAQGELALSTDGLAQIQAAQLTKALSATVAVDTGAAMPSAALLSRLADRALILGGTIADWWGKLSYDANFKLRNAIQQGMAQGENNQQIIARVIGKKGQPGIMEMSRRNAAAVVQTAVHTIASDARLKTLEMNADVAPKLVWRSTLDGLTCPVCIALNGLEWTNSQDGVHEPIGHKMPFENPPKHVNCRCGVFPMTTLLERLAKAGIKVPAATRASDMGPVPTSTTFDDFLRMKTKAQQDEQLGKGRADLWRRGVITLQQLMNQDGNAMTLAELRTKYE